jgi:hypothetical protein
MCVLGVLILEVAKLIHCSTLSSVAPDTNASEILEGQQTKQEDAQIHLNETVHVDRHNLNNNETVQKTSDITKSSGNNVNIILEASNAKRLGQFHQNTINASVSGATLDNVEQCITLATSKIKTPNTHIGKVILCLGTNDVTRNRDDSDQINITATQQDTRSPFQCVC